MSRSVIHVTRYARTLAASTGWLPELLCAPWLARTLLINPVNGVKVEQVLFGDTVK